MFKARVYSVRAFSESRLLTAIDLGVARAGQLQNVNIPVALPRLADLFEHLEFDDAADTLIVHPSNGRPSESKRSGLVQAFSACNLCRKFRTSVTPETQNRAWLGRLAPTWTVIPCGRAAKAASSAWSSPR